MYSILAGCAIALGCFANLYAGGGMVGAIMFSIGLVLICSFNWELYTGRVGTIGVNKKSLLMLCGNLYGAIAVAALISLTPYSVPLASAANAVIATRTPLSVIVMSIGTGVLMEAAVTLYKKTGQWYAVILPVAVFVFCGMPHCIADVFMYAIADTPLSVACCSIFASWLGNSFGALIIHYFNNNKKLGI